MVPQIKSTEITEVPNLDPQGFQPEDPEDFRCTFGLTIGPMSSDGGEQFYLSVCSPKWLSRECQNRGFFWGRNHLVVPRYNLETIREVINKFVLKCSGASWPEVAGKLRYLAAWEFDSYQES
jgi:hypothetical protein